MSQFRQWIDKIRGKFDFNSKDLQAFLFSAAIALIIFICHFIFGNYFVGAVWILVGVLLTIIILIVMLWAGFAVMEALFYIAAKLSLLILLAHSYCGLPLSQRSLTSNEALKNLLVIGFLYIIFDFLKSLWTGLKKSYLNFKESKPSFLNKVLTIAVFFIFVIWFIYEVILIINPIISNLCVLNK